MGKPTIQLDPSCVPLSFDGRRSHELDFLNVCFGWASEMESLIGSISLRISRGTDGERRLKAEFRWSGIEIETFYSEYGEYGGMFVVLSEDPKERIAYLDPEDILFEGILKPCLRNVVDKEISRLTDLRERITQQLEP